MRQPSPGLPGGEAGAFVDEVALTPLGEACLKPSVKAEYIDEGLYPKGFGGDRKAPNKSVLRFVMLRIALSVAYPLQGCARVGYVFLSLNVSKLCLRHASSPVGAPTDRKAPNRAYNDL